MGALRSGRDPGLASPLDGEASRGTVLCHVEDASQSRSREFLGSRQQFAQATSLLASRTLHTPFSGI